MSRIDELVAALCPDGVEYRKILSVTNVLYGAPFASELFGDVDGMPLIRIRDILRGSTNTRYSGDFDSEYVIHKGDILVGMDGDFNVGKWRDADALLNQRVLKIESKDLETLDNTFLYHLLGPLLKRVNDSILASTVKHLTARIIDTIEIPVPPIEVQREIVRILDAFTELTDTMTEELEARKAQYAYYRDRLLSLESLEALDGKPVEMVRLGDVCVRQKGMPITAAKMKELASEAGNVVVFGGGKTKVLANRDDLPKGNVIETPSVVVKSRGNIGFEYCDVPFTNKNELWSYAASSSNVDIKFIYHYLDSRRAFFQDAAKVGKLPQISTGITDDFQVSLPSLETQQKIVDILDRFDALTTSLTDGLPAEIEARKAQYGYYRDRLLDFPRKEAAAS